MRDGKLDWFLVVFCFAVMLATVWLWIWKEGMAQDDCIERGGEVVRIRGGDGAGWFCKE